MQERDIPFEAEETNPNSDQLSYVINDDEEKGQFKKSCLLVFCILLSLIILVFIVKHAGKKKNTLWIYTVGSPPTKEMLLSFTNEDDYLLFKQINKDHHLLREYCSYSLREEHYPDYKFLRIFVFGYKDWTLAVKENNDTLMVSDFRDLNEYCRRINPLRAKNISTSSFSNDELQHFIAFHIDNNYLNYRIFWEDKISNLKYDPIGNYMFLEDEFRYDNFKKSSYRYITKNLRSPYKQQYPGKKEVSVLIIDERWRGHKINKVFKTDTYDEDSYYSRFLDIHFHIEDDGEIRMEERPITNFLLSTYLKK